MKAILTHIGAWAPMAEQKQWLTTWEIGLILKNGWQNLNLK
jgi:hypothetical protein